MFKFEMIGCRIECEDLAVFQNLLGVVMTHCNDNLVPPTLATMVGCVGEYENQKIQQIKVVRNLTNLSLAEAKAWVEGQSQRLSRTMINQLTSAGFKVKTS